MNDANGHRAEPTESVGSPRVDQLGEALEGIDTELASAHTWTEWLDALPVVSNLAESARLSDYDRALLLHLPHLQAVCQRPRLLLRSEDERTSVARARRLSTRSVADLAARPEDWERRTITSVVPLRVLATHIEDDLDTYENRVVARLIDHLLRALARRLAHLREAWAMALEVEDAGTLQQSARRRRERLCSLWGRAWDSDATQQELADALRRLEGAETTLRGLLDSPLYRAIPRGASVAPTLHNTNVLASDGHYRRVAALWRLTIAQGHHRIPSLEERQRRRLAQQAAFVRFARLLVTSALRLVGWVPEPNSDSPPGAAGTSSWNRQPGGGLPGLPTITLAWSGRELRLSCGEGRTLCFVVGDVGKASDGRRAHSLSEARSEVIVLALDAGVVARPPASAATAVMVSPWRLDGTERVARILARWTARNTLPAYPLRRTLRGEPPVSLPKFLRLHGKDVISTQPVTKAERDAFVRTLLSTATRIEQQQAQQRAAGKPVSAATLDDLRALETLTAESSSYETLQRCPVCESSDATFEARVDDLSRATWWCRCRACTSEYGTRPCCACKAMYPVLIADGTRRSAEEECDVPVDLDLAYGKDLWAEPDAARTRSDCFRCTECGQ